MAKKKPIEGEAVEAAVKKTVRKRAPRAEIVKRESAELVEVASASAPQIISNDGEVNLTMIDASKNDYYRGIMKALDEKDLTSVSTYGSDLQKAMSSYSSDFLAHQMSSKLNEETRDLISGLLCKMREVDIDELDAPSKIKRILRRIPLLKKLVLSVEQIKTKYNTIEKNIDEIVQRLEATRQIAIRDNNMLQNKFENNCDYIAQLEDLIVAGKMKSVELGKKIDMMIKNANDYKDYEISDLEEYKSFLDKRINDLLMLRFAFKQSLTQIRIIQRTNIMDANTTEAQITMTIPLWKDQLSLAVALYNQKNSIAVKDMVTNATNDLLKKNSEMIKVQTIQVAEQTQRSVIDIETFRKTTTDLIDTVNGFMKAQMEGAAKRAAAEQELRALENQMTQAAIGVQESAKKIVSRELRGSSQNFLESINVGN